MSDLADVLCSEMKRLYDVNLSFDGEVKHFKTAVAYHPGKHRFDGLDSSLGLIELNRQKDFYLLWEKIQESYCLHIATAFSEDYQQKLLDACILHIKNLHPQVASSRLPLDLKEFVNNRHLDLLTSDRYPCSLEVFYIGESLQDTIRTFRSFSFAGSN